MAAIATDDLLLVIEAMKMETHVTAARDGRIAAIRVAEGDAVKVGQVLVAAPGDEGRQEELCHLLMALAGAAARDVLTVGAK